MSRVALGVVLAVLVGGLAAGGQARRLAEASCPAPQADPAYDFSVNAALASRQDAWGNQLLRAPGGPTYDRVRRYLHPLMLVGPPSGDSPNRLTDSGVYYLAFGRPAGPGGRRGVNLHVADGSQIVSQYVKQARLSVDVGGWERYGSCLPRLATPQLAGGYLPILRTSYVDAQGVHYEQESFATRIPETRSLVSFVKVKFDPRGSVRFLPSVSGLRRVRNQLRSAKKTFLVFSAGGRLDSGSVLYRARRRPLTVYAAWLARPSLTKEFRLDGREYLRARRSVAGYWNPQLAAGARLQVPDLHVMNAERNLLIQNLLHAWRYSVGNAYERWSWEMVDVAEVLGEYGFTGVEREIVLQAMHRGSLFPNRAAGVRMAGVADYYRRTGDVRFVDRVTPSLQALLGRFQEELLESPNGLLPRERYGVDISTLVYGLHDQALALAGLRAMAGVWAETKHADLAAQATAIANQLQSGLGAAVGLSSSWLPDGSFFIPIPLLEAYQPPYDSVTQSLGGSYWNLVMPYVLGSGLFPPGSPAATGLLRYMDEHGSRLLGLVRFRAFPNVGKAGYRAPGVDDVYGTNVARFLADNERPDQLVLSLYGKLGADMTQNTFVSGEGSTIGPVDGEYYRSLFRPPNAANNAFFLETLRLLLVHETRGADGVPEGLELAFSTPRRWLLPGKRIVVRGATTSFGNLSYTLTAGQRAVRAQLTVPSRVRPASLRLRLRLPVGDRLKSVAVGGHAFSRFDPGSGTIDLSGLKGRITLVASYS
ncbi:MAG TPA: hypothetical protein VKB73_12720 [Gaiellaceae bacterium]|nr:hypothetical protein [Gaiellaceae bacterium]